MGRGEIVIALNTSSKERALRWVDILSKEVDFFKVGLPLFVSSGREIIGELKKRNLRIFLDLKLCDIPSVVEETVKEISDLGVEFLTLYTMGGYEMLKAAREASRNLKIVGVTLLTSLGKEFLEDTLSSGQEVDEMVLKLSRIAMEAGLDGVVASGREVRMIKEKFGDSFIVVVPGVRLEKDKKFDQKRVVTPREAVEYGADIIVLGRSVTHSENPIEVLKMYKREIYGSNLT
jgi:orotidine-5'-phosphate decarboxylase